MTEGSGNNDRLDFTGLRVLIRDFFGPVASGKDVDEEEQLLSCVLYESFEFRCGLDPRYGSFGGAVLIGRTQDTIKFFGRKLSMNSDAGSVTESLTLVDAWCRAHLSDTFLAEFDSAVGPRP
jgi:hypothetical protein